MNCCLLLWIAAAMQATRLASLQLPQACSRLSSKFYKPSAQQAETAVRPFGALQILCVHEAQLWLVDGWGQPRTVDLSHPSLRSTLAFYFDCFLPASFLGEAA
jgi:hypothetical protein